MNNQNRRTLEESVIGAALIRGTFSEIDLLPQEFMFDNTREILNAGIQLEAKGQAIDPVTIVSIIGKSKILVSDVTRLLCEVPTGKNLPFYLEQLKRTIYSDKAQAAKQKASRLIVESDDPEPYARQLTAELDSLANRYLPSENNNRFQNVCVDLLQTIESGLPVEGYFKSNIKTLDNLLFGFCPPEYTIIAARPSVGKTAFCINLIAQLAFQDIRSCFFSLEMSANPIAARMLAFLSGANTKFALRSPNNINYLHREKMLKSSDKLIETSTKISMHDEPGQSINTIQQVARKEVKEKGAKLLIVDHIQHCKGSGENRRTEVENISMAFQDLLKELNVPGIMLSQIGRKIESENRRPNMSDLKESGAIEQHADNVVFLHRTKGTEKHNGYGLELICAKGRNIGTGVENMFFNTDTQAFEEVQS